MATIAVIVREMAAVITWLLETDDKRCLFCADWKATSEVKRTIPVLNKLLPVMLDTAISGEPIRSAANEVATSGNEVERAISKVPTKLALNPVMIPMFSPAMESPMLARAIKRTERL